MRKILVLTTLLLLTIIAGCGTQATPGEATTVAFPAFVYDSALSLQAYRLAVSLPKEHLAAIPCYCDCGRASGHTSLKDCFFKADGSFDDHASACHICAYEVIDLAQWSKEGKSLKQIRAMIDAKYHEYGEPTNTPPVE